MDLRVYYRKIRETEAAITEEFPLVISKETSDGGKPGVVMEVSRPLAAKLLVDGKAVLASEEHAISYWQEQEQRRLAAEKSELARRLQVAIIADPELQSARKK